MATADLMAPSMVTTFNACLRHGVFLPQWKEARLVTVLKGGVRDRGCVSSYRPICLLSTVGKIFERLLRDRIMECVEISPQQYGFTKERCTSDAIERVYALVRSSRCKLAIIITVDVVSAFNSLWWPHIMACLRTGGCPGDVYAVIQDYFKNRSVTLLDGPASRTISQERGCPQGSVLGPTLWNVAFDGLLGELARCKGVSPVAYADDLTMVVEGDTTEIIQERAQMAMDLAYRWCEERKMKISAEKTYCLEAKGMFRGNPPRIQGESGQQLQFVETVKFLGVHSDRRLRVQSHCINIAEKAKATFQGFRRIAKANWGIRFGQLALLYKAIFIPTITYAAGAWAGRATRAGLAKLVTAQRAALMTVTRAYCTISTPALLVIADATPIEFDLQKERLRHAIRRGETIRLDGNVYNPAQADAEQLWDALESAQQQLWQHLWTHDTRGRATYEFFPSIAERREASWVEPTYYVTQFLSGHGNFRSKLRKFNLVKNNKCQCGLEDTPLHTFFGCSKYLDLREQLRAQVESTGARWPITWADSVSKDIMPFMAKYVTSVLKRKEQWDKERR